MADPLRGEVWLADLDPVRGHEQGGRRPVLVVSDNGLNRSRAELVIVVPLTTRLRPLVSRVIVRPPEAGLRAVRSIICESMRVAAKERFIARWGDVSQQTMAEVERTLRQLLGL